MEQNKKQLAPFIRRTFRTPEQGKTPRIVTVTYEFDRNKKELKYGACIYKEDGTDFFSKKKHRETADSRLKVRPVIIDNIEDSGKMEEFHVRIRDLVRKHGVRGKQRIEGGRHHRQKVQPAPAIAQPAIPQPAEQMPAMSTK